MVKSFVLKDSPPEFIAAAQVKPMGRKYSKDESAKPGAVNIKDVVLGTKLACLAITDDKPDTLSKVGKRMPWHIEALKVITGSEEEAHKSLTSILSTHFNLTCDKIIDISGFAGRFVIDTQGYIAHNDEMIVLSYRCTTSASDWMTNFTTTTSEWEPEIDIPQGHSGHFSCLSGGWGCCDDEHKPRVHTGFYNNFLVTAPLIKQYIEPLLAPDQPPRKLYVVGHSLGAGVANMAACYFLLEHDWAKLPHKLMCITAGSPRSVKGPMRDIIQEEMQRLRPVNKAVICRVVRDKDMVASLPPALLGFAHLDKLCYITKSGDVLINPTLDNSHVFTEKEMKNLKLYDDIGSEATTIDESEMDTSEEEGGDTSEETNTDGQPVIKSAYERKVGRIPRALRDHMPDFYLKPLIALMEKEHPPKQPLEPIVEEEEEEEDSEVVKPVCKAKETKPAKQRSPFFWRRTRKAKVAQEE
jgi:hypothetical protein